MNQILDILRKAGRTVGKIPVTLLLSAIYMLIFPLYFPFVRFRHTVKNRSTESSYETLDKMF